LPSMWSGGATTSLPRLFRRCARHKRVWLPPHWGCELLFGEGLGSGHMGVSLR